jgi:hypothetical protein
MIEITKENYKDIKFDGIIVSVPYNIQPGQHDDISLIFECAYYTKGEHGYPHPGRGADNSSFYSVWYNDKEYLPNGLFFNGTSRFTLNYKFSHWDNYKYYKFKDMEEFCTWYLQQRGGEIWTSSEELIGKVKNIEPEKVKLSKEWIQEKCGTNTPPTEAPERPSMGNKKSKKVMKKSEYYKDILDYIEARLGLMYSLEEAVKTKDNSERQLHLHIAEQRQQEISRWLNEEIER